MLAPLARRILRSLVVVAFAVTAASLAHAQYSVTQLVSNLPGVAPHQDTNLVNAWGLTRGPSSPFWVSDQGTAHSTLYDGHGNAVPLVVSIPTVGTGFTGPSGIVFNDAQAFEVSENGRTEPAIFIFATVDGTISGWNFAVDLTHAILAANNSAAGASYNSLAIGTHGAHQLFATDNANNRIDVYDGSFRLINTLTDPTIPAGFSAYGIREIGDQIFVTFASTGNAPGGFIDIFSETGAFVKRFTEGEPLNQPWGMALAPSGFGPFSGALLVSNNTPGGRIHAFNLKTGKLLGTLNRPNGKPVEIDQVWGLDFGGGTEANGKANQLFFTAGPSNYSNGAFGVINFVGK